MGLVKYASPVLLMRVKPFFLSICREEETKPILAAAAEARTGGADGASEERE
jgi:hypothetical protein